MDFSPPVHPLHQPPQGSVARLRQHFEPSPRDSSSTTRTSFPPDGGRQLRIPVPPQPPRIAQLQRGPSIPYHRRSQDLLTQPPVYAQPRPHQRSEPDVEMDTLSHHPIAGLPVSSSYDDALGRETGLPQSRVPTQGVPQRPRLPVHPMHGQYPKRFSPLPSPGRPSPVRDPPAQYTPVEDAPKAPLSSPAPSASTWTPVPELHASTAAGTSHGPLTDHPPPLSQQQDFYASRARAACGQSLLIKDDDHTSTLSTATSAVPAHEVFRRDALPLDLPELDRHLDSYGTFQFSSTEDVLGPKEKATWHKFLAPPPRSWWQRLFSFSSTPKPKAKAKAPDVERESLGVSSTHGGPEDAVANDKSALFPPMHLLPPNMTVARLKQNKRQPPSRIKLPALLGTAVDGVLSMEASKWGISMLSLECFRDLVQLLSSLLAFTSFPTLAPDGGERGGSGKLRVTALGTFSQVLALDFVSVFGRAIIWMLVFAALAAFAVWEFMLMSGGVFTMGMRGSVDAGEGFDCEDEVLRKRIECKPDKSSLQRFRHSRGYQIFVVFLATTLYMPLSKVCVGALVWSSDFWAIENPYVSTDNPDLNTETPESRRAQSDFCYTTTMEADNFNWAWLVLPFAGLTIVWLTIFFPVRLATAVSRAVPKIDPYNDMGEKRRDTNAEYERLLEEDKHPLAFIYAFYRRPWCGFKSIVMAIKLVNVLALTILSKDTCLFRHTARSTMNIASQVVQFDVMLMFVILEIYVSPFIDRASNNNDWVARVGYVIIALFGLLVALQLPGYQHLQKWGVSLVTVVIYLFNAWFILVGKPFFKTWIKRGQRRVDFSIDVCSSHIDRSKHIAHRVWQETISLVLLTAADFAMAHGFKLRFAREPGCAPYLLAFQGTPAERLVENIQVLREIGLRAYVTAVEEQEAPQHVSLREVQEQIATCYCGVDMYWKPPTRPAKFSPPTSFFGRVTITPFPFTVTFRYDQQPKRPLQLSSLEDLILFLEQNQSDAALEARAVRKALRALDGQEVIWPYVHKPPSENVSGSFSGSSSANAHTSLEFERGVLRIQRNSTFYWRGYNHSSGFTVCIEYAHKTGDALQKQRTAATLSLPGEVMGVDLEFSLTPKITEFLTANSEVGDFRLPLIQAHLDGHRRYFHELDQQKRDILSYGFLLHILANDALRPSELQQVLKDMEANEALWTATADYSACFTFLEERLQSIDRSKTTQIWYLFWDDFWRCNSTSLAVVGNHPQIFSPYYRTSLCYQPMSRERLECILGGVDLAGDAQYLTSGLLNRLYFLLNQIAFHNIPTHDIAIDVDGEKTDFHKLASVAHSTISQETASMVLPGDAIQEDYAALRERGAFPFEKLYDRRTPSWSEPKAKMRHVLQRCGRSVVTWLGLTHVEHPVRKHGVALLLRENDHGLGLPRPEKRRLAEEEAEETVECIR